MPAWLDDPAAELLAEARQAFSRRQLFDRSILDDGDGSVILPWAGTTTSHTLALELQAAGVPVAVDGLALTCPGSPAPAVLTALRTLVDNGPSDPLELAALVSRVEENKYDPWLSEPLLRQDYATRRLDPVASHALARRLLSEASTNVAAS